MQDRRKQGGTTGENSSPRGRKTPSEPAFPQCRKGMILPKGTAADGAEAQRNFAARSAAGEGRPQAAQNRPAKFRSAERPRGGTTPGHAKAPSKIPRRRTPPGRDDPRPRRTPQQNLAAQNTAREGRPQATQNPPAKSRGAKRPRGATTPDHAEPPSKISRREAPPGRGVGRGVPSPQKAIAHRAAMRNRPVAKAPRS